MTRLNCPVPFCPHSADPAHHPGVTQWICRTHWALVDRKIRFLRKRIAERRKRGSPPDEMLERMDIRLQAKARTQAIERASANFFKAAE